MHALRLLILSLKNLSVGLWVILALFLFSGTILLFSRTDRPDAVEMWVFSPEHQLMYIPMIENHQRVLGSDELPLKLTLLSKDAIKSRMMSGFFGGLPTADLIEVERAAVGPVFKGPIEAIGFRDLTEQLKSEGLLDMFNPPSLLPWSVDGRVFGLPHDVHPVMLAYRADLVENAGIDLEGVETWDEFFDALRPMMSDDDDNGLPDRYAMSFWVTQLDNIELLLLQGGGQLFDESGAPTINRDRNVELLSTIVSWCVGPNRSVTDIDEFSAAGHQSRTDGDAIAFLCPDWMCSIWRMHVPAIGGKMKLMPLPAFESGGRRTSVRGGTMLGFPKTSTHFESAWESAKMLYTSPEIARELYRQVDIISPVRSLWNDPVYDEPDPFFMNQRKGRMFIELAPTIPVRSSSPYNQSALLELRDCAVNLMKWSQSNSRFDRVQLQSQARILLDRAQRNVERQMSRNAFTKVD